MSLLDSDAEELKKNGASELKSGRKVNQSGLGALKGLAKYSTLTAKYRTTGSAVAPTQVSSSAPVPSSSVEQFRGTNLSEVSAKSVQSPGDVGADLVVKILDKVSAKSVQPGPSDLALEVSAKSVQSPGDVSALKIEVEHLVDAAKVVATVATDAKTEIKPGGLNPFASSSKNTILKYNHDDKVSAKSVQSEADAPAITKEFDGRQALHDVVLRNDMKSVQSPGEVSAKSVQNNRSEAQIKVSAKSVQREAKLMPPVFEVSAKSVQSPGEVSAKSVREAQPGYGLTKVISRNIEEMSPTESISSLAGSQKLIVDFLFNLCVWNNSLITPPITKQQLLSETRLAEDTALSSIKRLRNKYIIDRHAYKDGKAGWTQYRFSETSYKEILHLQQLAQQPQRSSFTPVAMGTITAPLISTVVQFEDSWFKELDFSKIRPIQPMMVNATIRQMVQQKLQPEVVQDFINRFTSWMAMQGQIKNAIGLFCDKLKELAREGDSPVLQCMSAEERRAEAVLAQEIESTRAQIGELAQLQADKVQRQSLEDFDIKYRSWFAQISSEELKTLVPGNNIAPFGSDMHMALVKGYFEENIWPSQSGSTQP